MSGSIERALGLTCDRRGKWIGGCKFEARFDEVPPACRLDSELLNMMINDSTKYVVALTIREMTQQTYVHDICTTCGKIVTRTP